MGAGTGTCRRCAAVPFPTAAHRPQPRLAPGPTCAGYNRDLRVHSILEGSNEIMRVVINRELDKLDPKA